MWNRNSDYCQTATTDLKPMQPRLAKKLRPVSMRMQWHFVWCIRRPNDDAVDGININKRQALEWNRTQREYNYKNKNSRKIQNTTIKICAGMPVCTLDAIDVLLLFSFMHVSSRKEKMCIWQKRSQSFHSQMHNAHTMLLEKQFLIRSQMHIWPTATAYELTHTQFECITKFPDCNWMSCLFTHKKGKESVSSRRRARVRMHFPINDTFRQYLIYSISIWMQRTTH